VRGVPDDLIRAALTGPHAHVAVAGTERPVVRYAPDVAPFASLPVPPGPADWAELARLSGVGTHTGMRGPADLLDTLPGGWDVAFNAECVVMVATDALTGEPDPEAVELGEHDVPEILDLVARTRPGPFLPRTHELGSYLGIRRAGQLVSMAGERVRVPGWTEISTVCTDPAHRGQGLAGRLLRAVAHGIRAAGTVPILHAVTTNPAIRLYEEVGFETVGTVWYFGVIPPVEAA
jgi:ribosomal protein S18 acetylase RimI-like enzyme